MRFHLPKPLHGWREFVGEVGIIVLGVLIALGAEQAVETMHQRSEVDQLRQSLRAELADSRARWEHMRTADGCSAKRLDALNQWLAKAPKDATLQQAFPFFLWSMHSSAWDIAKSNPAINQLPVRERLTLASLYAGIDNFRGYFDIQRADVVQLSGLFATANQPENRRQIPLLLYKARSEVRMRQQNYPYFFKRFDELGIKADGRELAVSVDPNRLCGPPGS
jgi:hypothetical protein